jgi:hypothetical protein
MSSAAQITDSARILLDDAEAVNALNLSLEDIDWLVQTSQLQPIMIRGKRRFLRRDLEVLVNLYQSIQNRNPVSHDTEQTTHTVRTRPKEI